MWYNIKARYNRQTGCGTDRKVVEEYLVAAPSVSYAEAAVYNRLKEYTTRSESIEVKCIKEDPCSYVHCWDEGVCVARASVVPSGKTHVSVLDGEDGMTYYRAKIDNLYRTEAGSLRRLNSGMIIVEAPDFEEAVHQLRGYLGEGDGLYEIISVSKTSIMDIIMVKEV